MLGVEILGTTDWVGLAAVISAVFAGVATVIGALNRGTVKEINRRVDTNGDPREIGQIASDFGKLAAPTVTPAPEAPAAGE